MATVHALDPVAVRADFDIFEREFRGRRLAYLDSAATSLKPRVRGRGDERLPQYATAPTSTAASTRSARRRPRPTRAHGPRSRRSSAPTTRTRSSWCATRPRRSTSSPTRGAARTSAGRHHRGHRDGAPLEPHPVADARPGEGRRPRVRALRRGGPPASRSRYEVLLRTEPKLVAFTAVSNGIGTINPVAEMVAQGARGRCAGARRRRPGRAARAGQRPGAGLRLLRVLAATRRSGRQAPARCGRAARSSRRCRRSWVAAR